MVTHCSTNQAIRCLFTAERTGCETFIVLWPNTFIYLCTVYLYASRLVKVQVGSFHGANHGWENLRLKGGWRGDTVVIEAINPPSDFVVCYRALL